MKFRCRDHVRSSQNHCLWGIWYKRRGLYSLSRVKQGDRASKSVYCLPKTSSDSGKLKVYERKSKVVWFEWTWDNICNLRTIDRVAWIWNAINRNENASKQWTGSLWVDSYFYLSFHMSFSGCLCSFGWCLSLLSQFGEKPSYFLGFLVKLRKCVGMIALVQSRRGTPHVNPKR